MNGIPFRTVRKAKRNLRKAVRRITLILSSNGERSSNGLKHRILVGTHHKAGTVWIGQIFRTVCWEFGLQFFSGRQEDLPIDFDVFFQNHSQFDLTRMQAEYRGLHVIRDPRDVIISGCFYHQRAEEEWLNVKREEFGGLTYQQKINSYASFGDKLMFEMEYHSTAIRDMLAWSYSNPNFLEMRYEDLVADESLMLFHRIFNFLGFPGKMIPRLLQIAHEKSLFSGKVRTSLHVRSGESGQWRKWFKPVHRARFLELFGDALTRLGYETNNEWARS